MHEAAQRVGNCEQQLEFCTKMMVRLRTRADHGHPKANRGKGRSWVQIAMWSMLRALQKINKAKRLEGEAVISAPAFFQSAGRGDLKFLGEDDRHTVAVWTSLSESEQEQWSKKMGKSKDWVVWCRSRKKEEEHRPFDVDGTPCIWHVDGRLHFTAK